MPGWAKTAQRIVDDRRFWLAALFIVSFGVYAATLPSTVSFEDAPSS